MIKRISNDEFISKYGKFEFRVMCKHIPQDLALAKVNKKIGNYKINIGKKQVKFYRQDKNSVYLDFATIFIIGCNKIGQLIDGGVFDE
jgi:hypothetical protein